MDFSWILNFYWILYGCNIILLLSVWIFGTESNGASRWLRIGGFQFQPTELSKILIVMFFARFFMEHEENLNTLRTLVQTAILAAIPLMLIFSQPDLKNTITVVIPVSYTHLDVYKRQEWSGRIVLCVLSCKSRTCSACD